MNNESTQNQSEELAVYAIGASPAYRTDGTCFAATPHGLLVSHDHAASFSDAYASLKLPEALPTPAVAVSPCFPSDGTVFAGVYGAILRSHDRGATWHYSELRTPPPVVTCLAISPAYEQDGIVFAGTLQDGIFRSADRGERWASWNFGLIDLSVLCLALSPAYAEDETLLAGTETGLFRSTNGGRAWRELGFPTELAPVLSVALSPDYAKDGFLLAGTESSGLWISHDRGKGWHSAGTRGDEAVNALVVGKAHEQLMLIVVVGEEIRLSRDAGKTWETLQDTGEFAAMCIAAPSGLVAGAPLLAGCADGVVRQIRL